MRAKGSYKPNALEYEVTIDGKTAIIRLYENIKKYTEPDRETGEPGDTGWEFDRYTLQLPHSERLKAQVEAETSKWLEFTRREEVEQLRTTKLKMANDYADNAIHSGVSVLGCNFSLTEVDQINITSLASYLQAALKGEPSTINPSAGVPYHADGELCRYWPAEQFMEIFKAATAHVFYHRTYCNHLRSYIKSITSYGELDGVYYGMELPAEFAESLANLIGAGEAK